MHFYLHGQPYQELFVRAARNRICRRVQYEDVKRASNTVYVCLASPYKDLPTKLHFNVVEANLHKQVR